MIPHPKRTSAVLFLALAVPLALASDKPRPAPPVDPATKYIAVDAHPNEHVTIAAEPCIEPAACPFFRLPYVQHGFLPIRVIITNDRDQPLALDDARILFYPATGDKIQAATDEDINRRLFTKKSAAGTKIPLIPVTIHHEPIDQKITKDDNDFGFKSLTVAPHSTAAGYVFYDVRDVDDPVLIASELYLKEIRTTTEKGEKLELFGFTISFKKWLEAHPEK